jgi:sorbitol/mannitol transport system permease protein
MPAVIYVIVITQIPFVFTIWYSLQSWNLLTPNAKHFVGLANYKIIFTNSAFRSSLLNTVELTALTVIISMFVGGGIAMLLDRKFLGRGVVRTLLITPFLVMPTAASLLWKTTIFDPTYGLLNWFLSPLGVHHVAWLSVYPFASVVVELVWRWSPFMMLISLAGLQSQPGEVLEAARVDGASPVALFREITLPHLRPYVELGLLLGSIYVVNTFGTIYTMTNGGPGTATTNTPYYLYEQAFQYYNIGTAAALGIVTVVLTLIVAMFALRMILSVFRFEGSPP